MIIDRKGSHQHGTTDIVGRRCMVADYYSHVDLMSTINVIRKENTRLRQEPGRLN